MKETGEKGIDPLFKPQNGTSVEHIIHQELPDDHFSLPSSKTLSALFRAKYASIVSKPLQEPRKDKRDPSAFDVSSTGVTKIRAFPAGISGGTLRVI